MTRVVEIFSHDESFLLFTSAVPSVELIMMADIHAKNTKKSTQIISVNKNSKINNSERILSTLYL